MDNQTQPIISPTQPVVPITASPSSITPTPKKSSYLKTFFAAVGLILFGGLLGVVTAKYIPQIRTNDIQQTAVEPTITSTLPSPTSSAITPSTSLKTYTSKLEKLSFQYPSNWILSPINPQSVSPQESQFLIQDPNGKIRVTWTPLIDGIGGGCDPNIPFHQTSGEMGAPCPLYEVVDKQKLSNINLYYVAYIVTKNGLTYEPIIALQEQDGLLTTKRALAYLIFNGKNNGNLGVSLVGQGLTFGTKEEAQSFFSSPEAIQAKNILLSITY